MKYHSNLSTFLISILVLVLFVFTSALIILEFNLTSPTLIVTDSILGDFSKTSEDIKVSFSSVERNLSDRVLVNDVVVGYKGEEIAAFDTLEIKLSMLDLVRYLLTGRKTAELVFEKGSVKVPTTLLSGNGNGKDVGSPSLVEGRKGAKDDNPIPEILRKYSFYATFHNFDLMIGEQAEILDLDAEVNFGGTLESIDTTLYVPFIDFSLDGFEGEAHYLGLTLVHEDEFVLKALVDEFDLRTPYGVGKANDFAFKILLSSVLDFNPDEATASATCRSFSFRNEGQKVTAQGNNLMANYDFGTAKVSLDVFEANYGDMKATVVGVEGSLLSNNFLSLGIGEIQYSAYGLEGIVEDIRGSYLLSSGKGEVSVKEVSAEDLSSLTGGILGTATIKGFRGEGNLKERNLDLSLDFIAEPRRMFEKNIEGHFQGNVDFSDGIVHRLEVVDLLPGFGDKTASLSLGGDMSSMSYSLSYGDSLRADGDIQSTDLAMTSRISLDEFLVEEARPFFGETYAELAPYLNEDASLAGEITLGLHFDGDSYSKFLGDVGLDLSVKGAHYNVVESSVGLYSVIHLEKDRMTVEEIDVVTDYVDMKARGYLDYGRMLPEVSIDLSLHDGGRDLFHGDFNLGNGMEYDYAAVLPILGNSSFSGNLKLSQNHGSTASVLKTGEVERPFQASVDLDKRNLILFSDKLFFDFNFKEGIDALVEFHELDTFRNGYGVPIMLDGTMKLEAGRGRTYDFKSENLKLSSLWIVPGAPDLSLDLIGNENGFWFNNVKLKGDGELEFLGSGLFDVASSSFTFGLTETDGDGVIALSIYRDELFAGILRVENLEMGPFGLDGMEGNLNLAGRAVRLEDFSFSGNLNVKAKDQVNDDREITARLVLDTNALSLENLRYSSQGIDISVDNFTFDSLSGDVTLNDLDVYMKGEHADRDYPIALKLSASGKVPEGDNIYLSAFNIARNLGEGSSFRLDLEKLDIDNSMLLVQDLYTEGTINDRKLEMDGDLLAGYVDLFRRHANFTLDVMPVISLDADLDFSDKLWMNANLHAFNLYVMNLFFNAPLIVFDEDYMFGEIGLVQEDKETFVLSGYLGADEMSLEIFWAPDQRLTLHSPRFTIWENEARSSLTPTTLLDYLDYSRTPINTVIAFSFTPQLGFNGYEAGLYTGDNQQIRVRIPLPDNNIDIMGNVTGTYIFSSSDGQVTNDGTLNLYDTVITVGMNPYPEWYGLSGEMFIDLGFNFVRNNSIAYPAGPNPMVSITIADNSDLFFHLGRDGVAASGALDVRGGEIFYFNKYFYVLEGSVKFDDPKTLDPSLSIRAALREFDSEGNKVEIYLIMKDNKFDSLSPTFESNPNMELSEIMGILGQSILPESQYGEFSVSSVASLVSESYTLLQRMGVVKSNATGSNLNSSIKKLFGLDTFSIHTNIVNNFIIGTLADVADSRTELYSPMARYLDGTTLNVGKYLSPDLYLQAMIHLDKGRDRNSYTVFADDLMIDAELFLEWMAEPFTVTFFTTPKYTSFYSALDTFGFTVKKTIRF